MCRNSSTFDLSLRDIIELMPPKKRKLEGDRQGRKGKVSSLQRRFLFIIVHRLFSALFVHSRVWSAHSTMWCHVLSKKEVITTSRLLRRERRELDMSQSLRRMLALRSITRLARVQGRGGTALLHMLQGIPPSYACSYMCVCTVLLVLY